MVFNSSTMIKMVEEVIRDNDLPYQPTRIFEPPDKSWTWCAEFAGRKPATANPLHVCVQWPYGSSYESVKADLTRQLVAHFTR